MSRFKSLFAFDRNQQKGILYLAIITIVSLALYFYLKTRPPQQLRVITDPAIEFKTDSLIARATRRRDTIYPFNPNYITDYKGYKLGMTLPQIDRLLRFRESGKWINSTAQFKTVTQVDKKWLDSISPYFKFPDWVTNPKPRYKSKKFIPYADRKVVAQDINAATAAQLQKVYGIGPALSGRIIKERERLGGFIDIMQVNQIYGLKDSTLIRLRKSFFVPQSSTIKFNINTASREQLSTVPYFNDYLLDAIIEQRTLRDGFSSWDEVMLTSRFPEEKLALIQLYLTLD